MSNTLSIVVGSVLGASEYVAEALEEVAKKSGFDTLLQFEPNIETLPHSGTWVVCTSTHGAGDLPENIQPFAAALEECDLSAVNVYVVGLGDSSYDTFCFGAITMEQKLVNAGATLLAEPLHIDVLNHPIPEDIAVDWFSKQLQK